MVKEPQNAYDPNAIAVQTLTGQHLGYVPKEHTDRFPHDVTFGHIYSLGPNALGLWGVTVSTYVNVYKTKYIKQKACTLHPCRMCLITCQGNVQHCCVVSSFLA